MTQPTFQDEQVRLEALAWLTGRLRWEQLLGELHGRVEATGAPVAFGDAIPEAPATPVAPARAA